MIDPTLLQHHLQVAAQRWPSKHVLITPTGRHSFAEVLTSARRLAGLLQAQGVRKGDRVALYLDNGIEFVVGVYAILLVGAVFMPINPLTKSDKLAYILADASAIALLTQHHLQDTWEPALHNAPCTRIRIVAGMDPVEGLAPGCTPWPGEESDHPLDDSHEPIDADLAAILYTSGTSGRPKGVMLSHLNMLSAARSVCQYLGLHANDVIHCALPLAFGYGLYQVLMAVKVGASVVLERGFAFPVKSLALMAQEQVTVFPAVPTMFARLIALQGLPSAKLGALRMLTNAGAALPLAHIQRIRNAFPGAQLFSMYGLTECKRVSFLPPEQLDIRPDSVGRGMPNQDAWLEDDEGRRLPNGSTGELVIKGSHVMLGYWNLAEETEKRIRPGPMPGERLLYSGDLFRTDAQGWLYFVARRDDIIKSRGEKVSPREVENAIHTLPGVHEVAVVGVDDDALGQSIKAFVTLHPGFDLTERSVIRHCQETLEPHMVPRNVVFVADLPKTNTGKIKKTELGNTGP